MTINQFVLTFIAFGFIGILGAIAVCAFCWVLDWVDRVRNGKKYVRNKSNQFN